MRLDLVHEFEQTRRADARVAAFLALHESHNNRREAADRLGASAFAQFKTAVTSIDSTSALGQLQNLDTALVTQVDRQSILGALLDAGAVTLPAGFRGRLQVGAITGSTVVEGHRKPVYQLAFDLADAQPEPVQATIVVSRELFRDLDPTGVAGLRAILSSAVAGAVNARVLAQWTATTATAGEATAIDTLAALLLNVSGGAPSRPVLVTDWRVLLSLTPALADLRASGLVVVPIPEAANHMILVDAAGVLVTDAGLELGVAQYASVVLDNAGSPPDTPVISLFQTDQLAIRGERFVRVQFKDDALAHAAFGGSPV
jgi:hypothetical protein